MDIIADIITKTLGNKNSVALNFVCADQFGTTWHIDSDYGYYGIECPYGTDNYDIAENIRNAATKLNVTAHIANVSNDRVDVLINK